jgi:hypothetical protein
MILKLPTKSSDTPLELRRKMRKKTASTTMENAAQFVSSKANKFKKGY